MDIRNSGFLSIEQLTDRYPNLTGAAREETVQEGPTFGQVLAQKNLEKTQNDPIRFSKHASLRLNDRGIQLTNEQLGRLEDGTKKAASKGIKDSLVIVDELAFIVNVPNRMVVTAIDSATQNENVFTNINGAVIA